MLGPSWSMCFILELTNLVQVCPTHELDSLNYEVTNIMFLMKSKQTKSLSLTFLEYHNFISFESPKSTEMNSDDLNLFKNMNGGFK